MNIHCVCLILFMKIWFTYCLHSLFKVKVGIGMMTYQFAPFITGLNLKKYLKLLTMKLIGLLKCCRNSAKYV
jgi:hypothetical protein